MAYSLHHECANDFDTERGIMEKDIFDMRTAIDNLAELEVNALTDLLKDKEARKDPKVLQQVRAFMKDHKLQTTQNLVTIVQREVETKEIPIFDDEVDAITD